MSNSLLKKKKKKKILGSIDILSEIWIGFDLINYNTSNYKENFIVISIILITIKKIFIILNLIT